MIQHNITSVFIGTELKSGPPQRIGTALCTLRGRNANGESAALCLDEEILSRHMMLLGSTGTGKTNALFQIVSALRLAMSPEDVMVIFDTKGDFYERFYRPGDIVFSSDRMATGRTAKDYWNIFAELTDPESAAEDILEISRSLFYEKIEKSTAQPFFANAAKDLFAAILTHFYKNTAAVEQNNMRLKMFLDTVTTEGLRQILEHSTDSQALVSYIGQIDSQQTQGVISELQQLVREIFVGNFKKLGGLSMRRCIREKGAHTVFIEYDLGLGSLLTPVYRVLFDLAVKEALCRRKSEGKVWFIADEFKLLPNLQHIDDGINFGRGLGARFIIGLQNVQQIYHIYGENRAESILSGFLTTVNFRLNDAISRKYVQDLFGRNRKKEEFLSAVQTRGISESIREANVVEDWDLLRLPQGCTVVGLPFCEPFIFQFEKTV